MKRFSFLQKHDFRRVVILLFVLAICTQTFAYSPSQMYRPLDYVEMAGTDYDLFVTLPVYQNKKFVEDFLVKRFNVNRGEIKALLNYVYGVCFLMKCTDAKNYVVSCYVSCSIPKVAFDKIKGFLLDKNIFAERMSPSLVFVTNKQYKIDEMLHFGETSTNVDEIAKKTEIPFDFERKIVTDNPDDFLIFVKDFQAIMERIPDNIITFGIGRIVSRVYKDVDKFHNETYVQLKDERTSKLAVAILNKFFKNPKISVTKNNFVKITGIKNFADYIYDLIVAVIVANPE